MKIDLSRSILRQVARLKESREHQLATLKAMLAATDYKIIKCTEYALAGKELPYDIEELHDVRQAIRNEINGLEN